MTKIRFCKELLICNIKVTAIKFLIIWMFFLIDFGHKKPKRRIKPPCALKNRWRRNLYTVVALFKKLEIYHGFICRRTNWNLISTSFWGLLVPKTPQNKKFVKIILPNFQPLCFSNFMQKIKKSMHGSFNLKKQIFGPSSACLTQKSKIKSSRKFISVNFKP